MYHHVISVVCLGNVVGHSLTFYLMSSRRIGEDIRIDWVCPGKKTPPCNMENYMGHFRERHSTAGRAEAHLLSSIDKNVPAISPNLIHPQRQMTLTQYVCFHSRHSYNICNTLHRLLWHIQYRDELKRGIYVLWIWDEELFPLQENAKLSLIHGTCGPLFSLSPSRPFVPDSYSISS